ncbi:DoxX family membrane protein [Edaphobacter aggregans]|uniref:DoxX family membrane protein n=1 Tax=Edaphobacter aggregans TaxID=570835 RepID=UPI001FE10C09|nr:DoxX family membrane protein [Edaphobacter aggregans]
MNSKAAQLTENGTEIVRLFARFALGASFLSAVADRFGVWGPYGTKNVSWGDFAHFVEYTGAVTSLFPSSLTVSFAWAATVAETLLGILLIAGFKTRMTSVPLRPSSFVICYGYGHRSWHQDAIRLFGLLCGRCSILTGVLGA